MAGNLLNGHNWQRETEHNNMSQKENVAGVGGGEEGASDFSDRHEDPGQFTFNKCSRISNYVCFWKLIHVSLAAIFILASFK